VQIERSSRLSEIDGAKLQLKKAERNYERAKKLFADNLVSLETYDNATTEFDLAKNTLERSDKDLRLVEDRISKTKIVAPFDCTVLTRPVSVGQAVSGSGGFNSGTEVMTIANLQDMIIMAHINQADVAHLTNGQHVDINVESVNGLKMTGEVERIAPQATLRNNLKGYAVRITIKTIDPRARPGMTATLSIPVGSSKDTLSIPIAAVFTEPNLETMEMERYVYIKKDEGAYERRQIQLGLTDNNYAEILKGLKLGEAVSLELPPPDVEIKTVTDSASKVVAAVTNRTAAVIVR
jgi:RND family efflux transporter MFP subunit